MGDISSENCDFRAKNGLKSAFQPSKAYFRLFLALKSQFLQEIAPIDNKYDAART